MATYQEAMAALGPVGVAMGEVSAVTPCALGYYARVGLHGATGPTPAEAVRALLVLLSELVARAVHTTVRERQCDALATAFEAIGGRWWEV